MVPQANMVAIGADTGEKKDPVSLDVELSLPPFPGRKQACTTITVERVRTRQENVSRLLFNTIQLLVAVAIPILVILFIAFQIPPGTMMGLVQHPVTNNVEVVIPPQEKAEKLDFPKGFPLISTMDPLTYSNYNPRKYDNEEMAKIQDEVMTALFAQMPALILDAMDDFLTASTPTEESKLDMGQNEEVVQLDDLVHKLLQGNVGQKAKPQEKPEFTHNVPIFGGFGFGHPYPLQFGVQQKDPIIETIPPVLNPAAADNVDSWPIWKYVGDDENENAPHGQTPDDAIPLSPMFDGIEDSDEDGGLWSAMV